MRWLAIGVGVLAGGCAQDPIGVRTSAIVGGGPTSEYPAVLLLQRPDGAFCTGTLVAPDVVLTAAHCGLTPDWTATVMSVDEPIASRDVVDVVFHRYYGHGDFMTAHDLSLAKLSGDLPVEPIPFVTAAFDRPPVGESVVGVGFGVDDGADLTGGGVKRVAVFPISYVSADYLESGGPGVSVCYGDSGGPAFLDLDGVQTVVGVTSGTGETCRNVSRWTRVDMYAGEFVVPFVDAWSGPCAWDGTCVTEGCRTADPDCGPCGIDGICSAGCDVLDLDCPLAGVLGDACSSPDDCESRLCVEGGDGQTTCSETCDGVEHFCHAGYLCEEQTGTKVCVMKAPDEGGCAVAADGRPVGPAVLLLSCLACSRGPRRRRRCPGTP